MATTLQIDLDKKAIDIVTLFPGATSTGVKFALFSGHLPTSELDLPWKPQLPARLPPLS